MIKAENYAETVRIAGEAAQIAVEFEEVARGVRTSFCETLGDKKGDALYEYCLANAREDRRKKTEERIKELPGSKEDAAQSKGIRETGRLRAYFKARGERKEKK